MQSHTLVLAVFVPVAYQSFNSVVYEMSLYESIHLWVDTDMAMSKLSSFAV